MTSDVFSEGLRKTYTAFCKECLKTAALPSQHQSSRRLATYRILYTINKQVISLPVVVISQRQEKRLPAVRYRHLSSSVAVAAAAADDDDDDDDDEEQEDDVDYYHYPDE